MCDCSVSEWLQGQHSAEARLHKPAETTIANSTGKASCCLHGCCIMVSCRHCTNGSAAALDCLQRSGTSSRTHHPDLQ